MIDSGVDVENASRHTLFNTLLLSALLNRREVQLVISDQSRSAVVILASPKTLGHSPKAMREGLACIERHPAPGWSPVKAAAALASARELFAAPLENWINWTLPRLSEEIERRTGHRISHSRLSVVLRKKGPLPASDPATR